MLGKKSIYRRPAVILASVVVLLLLNLVVVNNPMFATRVIDLTEQTDSVSEMSVDESNAQLAEMAEVEAAQVQQTLDVAEEDTSVKGELKSGLRKFWLLTGFRNCKLGNLIMILVGIIFIFLAVKFEFEPMLLIPIGTGIICGNIPFFQGYGVSLNDALIYAQTVLESGTYGFDLDAAKALLGAVFAGSNGDNMVLSEAIKVVDKMDLTQVGIAAANIEDVKLFLTQVFEPGELNLQTGLYQQGSVLNYLYFGVNKGIYPPLIFLGIGAMTDFSSLIANPKLMILGAAAQLGVFLTFIGALYLGFNLREAGAIGIIGGADGPTAIFLSSRLANGADGTRNLIGHRSLFLHGFGTRDPAAYHPFADQQGRTPHQDEGSPHGEQDRKDYVPHRWPYPDYFHQPHGSAAAGYVVLR